MQNMVEVIKKITIFVILANLMYSHRASGYISNTSRPVSCQGSAATIDFDFDLQGDSIEPKSEVWYFNRILIGQDIGSGFTALGNYSGRLTNHSTHGLTLNSVTTADQGTYEYEIFLATGLTVKTATASLTVYIGPQPPPSPPGCSLNASQSDNTVTCTVSGNCGTPPLIPSWVNFTIPSNQFECTVKGTYQCCATSAASASCYSGSPNDFCILFDCTPVTTTTPTATTTPSPLPKIIPPSVVGVAIIVILLILFCCGCLDCCQLCRIFDHYEVNKFCYVTWYIIKRGCCSFFYCKSGSKRGKCFCGDHKEERCGGCLSCRNKCTCGWPGNCKTTDSSCGGFWFCVCCVTARREEEDPLVLCIDNEDALCRPEDDKVTITCSVNGYGPGDTTVAWTGPQGNKLTNSTKHNITPYNKDTGKSSLTISTLCSSDNGQYTCQVTDGDGFFVKNSILITVHDTDRNTNRKGSSAAVSREHVELHMERKGVMGGDEERAPGIHIGTEKKVNPEASSKKTKDRPQPPVAILTEDIPKLRPQPPPPENSYVNDRNLRGISANFDDSHGLPSDIPRSSRLPPLTQSTVEEEDASEKPKKKRNKKKKKAKLNEGTSEEGMDESKSKRTLSEDQFAED